MTERGISWRQTGIEGSMKKRRQRRRERRGDEEETETGERRGNKASNSLASEAP